MRIAMVNLTSGGLSGGYLKYLLRVVPLLRVHGAIGRLDVLTPQVMLPELAEHASGVLAWPDGDWLRGFRRLKAMLVSLAPDVVWIPTARWLHSDRPTVVMVRNTEPIDWPLWRNPPMEAVRNVLRARQGHVAWRPTWSCGCAWAGKPHYLCETQ